MEQNLHNVETTPDSNRGIKYTTDSSRDISDFVTNRYGEFWDSSCEKSRVPVKKKKSPKFKMFGPLCNQMVNLKTDS